METTLKTAEFDLVAANYHEMFNTLIKGVESLAPDVKATKPDVRAEVNQHITWAKQHLKKQNWITWYLRWVRAMIAYDVFGGYEPTEKQYVDPIIKSLEAQTGLSDIIRYGIFRGDHKAQVQRLQENLDHYMGIPAQGIQNYPVNKESPEDLFDKLRKIEKEWAEEAKSLLQPHEDDEIVVQFADGWAWWKLGRGYCSEEAKAMGHCGNVAGKSRPDERILSLRKLVKHGSAAMWSPALTFILDGQGWLGEMKGRANEKPAEKYHPYIVGLLERTDIVKGIKGGGYLPTHNFSLADLDGDQQDRLAELNPNLQSAGRQLRKAQANPEEMPAFIQRIQEISNIDGTWDDALKGWVTEKWDTPADFIESEMHSGGIKSTWQLMELDVSTTSYEGNQCVRKVVDSLTPDDLNVVYKYLYAQPGVKQQLEQDSKLVDSKMGGKDLLQSFLLNRSGPVNQNARAVAHWLKDRMLNAWKAGMTEPVRADMAETIKEGLLDTHARDGRGLRFDETDKFWQSPVLAFYPLYLAVDKVDNTGVFEDEDFDPNDGDYGDTWESDYNYRDAIHRVYDRTVLNKIDQAKAQLDEDDRANVDRMRDNFWRGDTRQYMDWVDSIVPGTFDEAKKKSWDSEAARSYLHQELQQMTLPMESEPWLLAPNAIKMPQYQHGASLLQKGASFEIIAANYEEMFNGIKPILQECHGLGAMPKWTLVTQEISWAKSTLKKQDRIVWWLRWFRLALLDSMVSSLRYVAEPLKTHDPEIQQNIAKYTSPFQKAQKLQENEQRAMGSRIGRELLGYPGIDLPSFLRTHSLYQHMLSLPVPAIQNTVWDKQTPDQLRRGFQEAEKVWQEETKGLLQPNLEPVYKNTPGQRGQDNPHELEEEDAGEVDTVFLPFQDGWAWWKLSRAYCSEEAKAMGHCGNVVGQKKSDERILSLRKPVKRGNEDYWEPHLTFILEPNGKLGEMKGRANAKPAPQYHQYIVPLLEDPRIKGIRGGGYAPENNFAFTDLPQETQEAVVQKNPGMMQLSRRLKLLQQGASPGQENLFPATDQQWQTLIKDIEEILWPEDDEGSYGDEPGKFDKKRNGWITKEWSSVEALVEDKGNDSAKWVAKQVSEGSDFYYAEGLSYTDALQSMNSQQETMLKRFIEVEYPEGVQQWKDNQTEEGAEDPDWNDVELAEFIEQYDPGDVSADLYRALETGYQYGAESEMYKALVSAVEEYTIPDTGEEVILPRYKNKDDHEGITWDSKVFTFLSLANSAALADKGEPWSYWAGDDSDVEISVSEPYNGWSGFDDKAFDEELKGSFGHPETAENKAKEKAEQQKKLEAIAKKYPQAGAKRDAKGEIVGWEKSPFTDGQQKLWDVENKKPKTKAKPKTKTRGASLKLAYDNSQFVPGKNELLQKLKALPYAADIRVFGSMAGERADRHPADVDLFIDLRGKTKHSAWTDLLRLAKEYYGYLDPFIIADAGVINGKPIFDLWGRNDHATGWIRSRNKKKMLKNMSQQGKPLTAIRPLEVKQAAGWIGPYFHHTTEDFDVFDPAIGGGAGEGGTHFGPVEQTNALSGKVPSQGGRTIPVYLKVQNPIRLKDLGTFRPDVILGQLTDLKVITQEQYDELLDNDSLADPETVWKILEDHGYDGIVYLNRREGTGHTEEQGENRDLDYVGDDEFRVNIPDAKDSYIVWRREQIRSAIAGKQAMAKFPKTASRQFTPQEIEQDAAMWQDQFGKDEPGGGPATKYVWHQDDHFPVSRLSGTAAEWKEWFDQEKEWAAEGGRPEQYFEKMEQWWTSNPDEHMVVAQGTDGQFYVWEGTHRQAISKIHNMQTVPAFVGVPKPTEPKTGKVAAEKWYHGTSKANGAKILAEGYLRPGMESRYKNEDIPRDDAVYVTKHPTVAQDYAYEADRTGGTILEVQVDPSKLMIDEDTIYDACQRGGLGRQEDPQIVDEIRKTFLKVWNSEAETNAAMGANTPPASSFEEAWAEFEANTEEAPAEVAEWMKHVAEDIRKHNPALTSEIVGLKGLAAHIGPAKVLGVLKDRPDGKVGGIEIDKSYKGKAPDVATVLHIEVPQEAREHFWSDPPEGNLEFWAFSDRPKAFINEKIIFTFNKKPVAEARILKIEEPGASKCEQTGRYEKHHKVFWSPNDFKKLGAAEPEVHFVITVWPITYDNSPQGYTVQRPPLEQYVKIVSSVPELRREVLAAAARYEGKQDTFVTSGFFMNYTDKDEPKMRGLKQFWEKPILTKKASVNPGVLYHGVSSEFRDDITKNGLNPNNYDSDGIFFTTKVSERGSWIDVWAVNVKGLYIEPDLTTMLDPSEEERFGAPWWVCYEPIAPERLQLVRPAPKTAAVPDDPGVSKPVSMEYDAVRFVVKYYQDNNLQQLSWKDFQKTFQQFAAKYNVLFTQIRKNQPQVTLQDLQAWLEDHAYSTEEPEFGVSYERYHEPETSHRDVEQLVLQINRGANAERILAEDSALSQYVDMVNQSSRASGHPATGNTVGWLRVDFVNDEWLLIDEVQSDLVNSVSQAKLILEADTFEDFMASLANDKMRELVHEKGIGPGNFSAAKRNFTAQGYTLDTLEAIKQKLLLLSKNWAEYAVASVLEIARRQSIKNVAIHTAETIGQRDPGVETNKIKIFYDNIAKSFGFKKQQLNFEGMQGNFWVRTASISKQAKRIGPVYHGTDHIFDEFSLDTAAEGVIFFSEDLSHAKRFGKYIITAYLNLKNPLNVDGAEIPRDHTLDDIDAITERAYAAGNDSVFIKDFPDSPGDPSAPTANTWLAFDPNQVEIIGREESHKTASVGGYKIDAQQSGDAVWIDWFEVPQADRGKGLGRKYYEAWEASLPKSIKLLRLFAADSGNGPAAGFWEKMGFHYIYDSEQGDETDQYMWKGINGNPTPSSLAGERDEPDIEDEPEKGNKQATLLGQEFDHSESIISADALLKYIQGIHEDGFEDRDRIWAHPQWELTKVNVGDFPQAKFNLDEPWNETTKKQCEQYAAMSGEFPPVVIDADGEIIDGYRRIAAAMLRGDTTIRAYVPSDAKNKRGGIEPDNGKTETTDDYLYHVSPKSNLGSIKTNGLRHDLEPNFYDTPPGVYFTSPKGLEFWQREVQNYFESPVIVLRVSKQNLQGLVPDEQAQEDSGAVAFRAPYPIPAEDIEIQTEQGWEKLKQVKTSAADTVTLYHGTCPENAKMLIEKGWQPDQSSVGGNMGQTKYLYLSSHPEDARWFANEKGCDTVLELRNVPLSSLVVDPEDGVGETVEEELNNDIGLPGKVVLTQPLAAAHFKILSQKTAAARAIYYHGTAAKNLRAILTEGLVPEGKSKSWADDPDAGLVNPSRQTYGGIYLTRNLMTAIGAPRDEKSKPDYRMVIVIAEVQPNTLFLDEDSIVGILDSPFGNYNRDTSEMSVGESFMMMLPNAPPSMKEILYNQQASYVENVIKQLKHQLEEHKLSMASDLEQRVRELLPGVFAASLSRRVSHAYKSDERRIKEDGYDARNYDYQRAYHRIMGDQAEVPAKDTIIPTPQDGEAGFRTAAEQLTRTLRSLLRIQQKGGWSFMNARVTEPIGYSGSNHITAVLEVREGRAHRIEYNDPEGWNGKSSMTPIVVHYGSVPEDFKKQWDERVGSKIYWLKPGETPPASTYVKPEPKPKVQAPAQEAVTASKTAGKAFEQKLYRGQREVQMGRPYASDPGDFGRGIYWTSDIYRARAYGKNVLEEVVRLENPLYLTVEQAYDLEEKEYGDLLHGTHEQRLERAENMTKDLLSKGYDGLVATDKNGTVEVVDYRPYRSKQASDDPDFDPADHYCHGACWIYALAVHKLTGWPMASVNDADEGIVHCVTVKPNGKLYDAKGESTLQEIGERYGLVNPFTEPIGEAGIEAVYGVDDFELTDAIEFAKQKLNIKSASGKTAADFPTFEQVMDESTDTNNEFDLSIHEFRTTDDWREKYEETLAFWKSRKFPLTVYRVVYAASDSEVRKRDAGLSWSLNSAAAYAVTKGLQSERGLKGHEPFLMQGTLKDDSGVNWVDTFRAWMTLGDEEEVRLKPGARVETNGRTITAGIDLTKVALSKTSKFLYHVTTAANTESIKKSGLLTKYYGQIHGGTDLHPPKPAIYLSRKTTSDNLPTSLFEKGPLIVIQVDLAQLNPDELWPDDFIYNEFAEGEILSSPQEVAEALNVPVEQGQKVLEQLETAADAELVLALKPFWQWYLSSAKGGEVAYTADIPPSAITRITPYKTAGKTADRMNEEGFWAGEGNAASGILPVCPKTGNVGLAMRSSKVDSPNCYGTIGGAIKPGKSPSESAKIELKEETGYDGAINLIPAYVFTSGGGFKYYNFVGVVQSEFSLNPGRGSSAGIKHEDETASLDWVPYAEVVEDMKANPGDYHPGMLKFFQNSKQIIEKALTKSAAKQAGQTVSGKVVAQHILDTSVRFGDSRPFLTDLREAYQLMGVDPETGANAKYELKDVPLELLTPGDDYSPAVARQYADMDTPFPAIVMDSYPSGSVFTGTILDGNHRAAAAKMRGDKTIQAYIPATSPKPPAKNDPDLDDLYDSLKSGALLPENTSNLVLSDVETPNVSCDVGVFLKDADGKTWGHLYALNDDGWLRPGDVLIDPAYRGQGWGKAMYLRLLTVAKQKGLKGIMSGWSVSDKAERVWKSFGAKTDPRTGVWYVTAASAKLIPAEDVVKHYHDLHHSIEPGDKQWILFHKWTLKEIPLSSIQDDIGPGKEREGYPGGVIDEAVAKEYCNLTTPYPPIIMFNEAGEVMDGFHRVYAARCRGDQTIMAYVPVMLSAKSAAMPPRKHTPEGAQELIAQLQQRITEADFKVIGSVAQGQTSLNDLDILVTPRGSISFEMESSWLETSGLEAYMKSIGFEYLGPSYFDEAESAERSEISGKMLDARGSTAEKFFNANSGHTVEFWLTPDWDDADWVEKTSAAKTAVFHPNAEDRAKMKAFREGMTFPLTVYRAIDANPQDVSLDGIGPFWTVTEDCAMPHYNSEDKLDNPTVFRGEVWENAIDWEETFFQNIRYDWSEDEVYVKPGSDIRLTGMRQSGDWQTPLEPYVTAAAKTAADKDALTAYMNDLWAQTWANPINGRERVYGEDAIIEARPFDGRIHLSFIRSVEKGKGQGSKGLDFLIQLANKHGVEIELDAKPVGRDGLRKTQLIMWYKRHGFKGTTDHLIYTPPTKPLKLGPKMKEVPMKGQSAKEAAGEKQMPAKIAARVNGGWIGPVYHGTNQEFDNFELRPGTRIIGFGEFQVQAGGFFFTDNYEEAEKYGKNVMTCYLRMKKPLVQQEQQYSLSKKQIKDLTYICEPLMSSSYADLHGTPAKMIELGAFAIDVDEQGDWLNEVVKENGIEWNVLDNQQAVARMKERGYDSTMVDEDNGKYSYFVISPDQIKATKVAASKVARPTDQKIQLLKQRFKFDDQTIEQIIQTDPTEKDYVQWIGTQVGKKTIRLPEDQAKIKQQLETFNKLKRSPQFQGSKDIQTYTPSSLYEMLQNNAQPEQFSQKEQERQQVEKGAQIIVSQGDYKVYYIRSEREDDVRLYGAPEFGSSAAALCSLSGGTNWCTAQNNYSREYLEDGPSYVMFYKGSAYAQLHPQSDQFMDRTDDSLVETIMVHHNGRPSTHRTAHYILVDPVAWQFLQLLSPVADDVRNWASKLEDPNSINAVEAEMDTSQRIKLAIAQGKRLPAEVEEEFIHKPSNMVVRSELVNTYIERVVKQRVPRWESSIINFWGDIEVSRLMEISLDYINKVIRARWPAFESAVSELKALYDEAVPLARYCATYNVRMPKVEETLLSGSGWRNTRTRGVQQVAVEYAAKLVPDGDSFRTALERELLGVLTPETVDYAAKVKGRWPELETELLRGGDRRYEPMDLQVRPLYKQCLDYATRVLKARWPEFEHKLIGVVSAHPWTFPVARPDTYIVAPYVEKVIGDRWPEFEQMLLKVLEEVKTVTPEWSLVFHDYLQALETVGRNWPEGEAAYKKTTGKPSR